MKPKSIAARASRLSIAPMMDWTDRHCRMLHRAFTRQALLYTEMLTTGAVLHGPTERLLAFDPRERPLALQLGGADPEALGRATHIARMAGYDEVNLNVGCPSDRVKSGCFGAVLMREPDLVGECVAAMIDATDGIPVTVKCRIGVDDDLPEEVLPHFLRTVAARGATRFIVHARKAWLQGLNPKQNREIPPLDYGLVRDMKAAFPELSIVINGGICDVDEALAHLRGGLDGVMIGRSAYHTPAILGTVDRDIFAAGTAYVRAEDAVAKMLPYVEGQLANGVRLHQITRHMIGAFHGRPGARAWRRILSEDAQRPGAGLEVLEAALGAVTASREHISRVPNAPRPVTPARRDASPVGPGASVAHRPRVRAARP